MLNSPLKIQWDRNHLEICIQMHTCPSHVYLCLWTFIFSTSFQSIKALPNAVSTLHTHHAACQISLKFELILELTSQMIRLPAASGYVFVFLPFIVCFNRCDVLDWLPSLKLIHNNRIDWYNKKKKVLISGEHILIIYFVPLWWILRALCLLLLVCHCSRMCIKLFLSVNHKNCRQTWTSVMSHRRLKPDLD